MGKKVVLSPTAKTKLSNLLDYLETEWSARVKKDFIKKLDQSISRISQYPKSCPESIEVKGLFKCVVTKQTSLFYRIKTKEIEVVTQIEPKRIIHQPEAGALGIEVGGHLNLKAGLCQVQRLKDQKNIEQNLVNQVALVKGHIQRVHVKI